MSNAPNANSNQNNTGQQVSNEQNNNNSSVGIPVIANGAKCTCAGSSDPSSQVGIIALSQSRVLVNGGTLLAATTNDKTVASLNFGTCKITRSACSANIEWQNPYAETTILGSLKILTMNSFGICKGSKIEFVTCGQSEQITPATTKDIKGLDTQQLSQENPTTSENDIQSQVSSGTGQDPLADLEKTVQEMLEQPVIEVLETGAGDSKPIESITPITFPQTKIRGTVKQPRGVSCTFKGASSGAYYWKVRSDDMSILKEKSGAGQITIRFPKLGRYVIEAYKSTSYVKQGTTIEQIETSSKDFKNALIIEVVENEITLKAQKTKCPVDDTVHISFEKLFSTLDTDIGQISYQVFSQGILLADNTRVEVTGNTQAASAKFKSTGSYVVHATSSNGIKINPTKSITVEALLVKQVTAKGVQKYKARKGEDLELKAVLNYDTPENQQKIKWEVFHSETENGSQTKCYPIVNGAILNNKPPINIFTKIGFYSIYAFINGRSNSVKAEVEVCQPNYVSTKWKDLNGNIIREIGKREAVYADVNMEGVCGLAIKFEVYSLAANKLIEEISIARMVSNTAVYTLKLSESAIKELTDGDKLYIKSSIKDNNQIVLINKGRAPKDYPITYTTKEKITSLQFYADKDCKQGIASASYGNVIYARVLTRNLSGKALELYMYRNTPGMLWGTNDIELYKEEKTVNDDGYAVFNIKIAKNWKKEDAKDSYLTVVTEKGDDYWKKKGIRNWERNDTAENTFEINRNLQFLRLENNAPAPMAQNKTTTTVNQVPSNASSNGNCPRCNAAIRGTKAECKSENEFALKDIFPNVSDDTLKIVANTYTKYMKQLGMNTCWNKAHFFAQAAIETGYTLNIPDGEGFNYYWESLITTFGAFQTVEGREKAKLWGRKVKDRNQSGYVPVPIETQIKIANYAYGPPAAKAKELGNTNPNDGWLYKGQGIIQLTGKDAYTYANEYTLKENVNIINFPNKVSTDITIGVLSAMAFWKWKKIYLIANSKTKDVKGKICPKVGKNVSKIGKNGKHSTNYDEKQRAFNEETSKLFRIDECQFGIINLTETDIITYHSYANNKGTIIRQIPKINKQEGFYRFIYHDKNDKEHVIGVYPWIKSSMFQSGTSQRTILPGYKKTYQYSNKDAIDGKMAYYYYNNNDEIDAIIVEPKSGSSFPQRIYKSVKDNNGKVKTTTLVKCEELNYVVGDLKIQYKIDQNQTERIYSDPAVLAILIGVLAEVGKPCKGTGITSQDGTGFPSQTHVNGFGIDFNYEDREKEKKIISEMLLFGCSRYYFGTSSNYDSLPTNGNIGRRNSAHNSHLHMGGFDNMKLKEINNK